MKDVLTFIKLVIIASIALALLFAGYTFYDAYKSRRIFVPPPPMTEHERQLAEFDKTLRFAFKWSLLALVAVSGFGAAQRFLLVPAAKAREEIHYNPETGMLPVVRRNVAPIWKRIVGHNEYDEFDGNLSMTPHRKVYSNGQMIVAAETDGVDATTQAEYARASWGVQGSIARGGRGKTIGEARFLSGEFHEKAQVQRERSIAMREKRELQTQKSLPALDITASVLPDIDLYTAIEQSTDRAWVIGQATELQPVQGFKEVGKLVTFDPRTTHGAIIGGTGSGKTASTGLLMALYARRFGLHPIVLDGKEGIDWGPLNGVVEWHAMSADTIEAQLDSVMRIFQKRWDYLRDNEIPNIYKIPADKRPVPIFLLVEEFGDVWAELRNSDKSLYKELGQRVDRLFRLARATGITLCLIDQSPEKWSQQMRGNAKFVVCYKLKGGVANAFNEYHVDKLPNVGVFSQDNVFYRPWHTEVEVDLTRMFPPLERKLLTERPRTATNASSPVVRTNERPKTEEAKSNNIVTIPPSIRRSFVRTGSWHDVCRELFSVHPSMSQAQLRNTMVDIEGTGKEPNQFKGVAFEMFHRYSPDGDRTKFPQGISS